MRISNEFDCLSLLSLRCATVILDAVVVILLCRVEEIGGVAGFAVERTNGSGWSIRTSER